MDIQIRNVTTKPIQTPNGPFLPGKSTTNWKIGPMQPPRVYISEALERFWDKIGKKIRKAGLVREEPKTMPFHHEYTYGNHVSSL